MESDHVLRFIGYWDALSEALADEGRLIRYLLIVSSNFPGAEGERHPFYGRADEIREKTGLGLVYLTASDLAWASAQVESRDLSLDARRSIDWPAVFDRGIVRSGDIAAAVAAVGG
jgi:hypothetical protein